MIKRKDGIINNIVYNNTVYDNGNYHIYPTLNDLKTLIDEIKKSNSTTKYLKFTPFYINLKINRQIEYEDFIFYMECIKNCTENDVNQFIENCQDKKIEYMSTDEYNNAKIQFVLCEETDVFKFNSSLDKYLDYLYLIIPGLVNDLKHKYNINDNDLLLGCFCFEINCG